MSIALLPQEAARAIGSISALYDSCSVIKELVDNALDAEATSISIEISENTLDTVVVKDNGTGISAEGRDLVCRPNCTSKLQDVGDLRRVGAHSLGFRGLAMSSIAETCEVVTVTTRTRQKAVGAILSFRRDGTLIGEDKIAHPVGTTVRLKGFLTRLPVRRQVMLKRASSTIVRITELVKAYSLARLSIRFSLRAMNSKSNSPWTYAPIGPYSHADAVLNVCGKDIVNQCDCFSWPEQVSEDGTSARLIALLPRIDADIKKATGSQYISVDGRPLASNRGIAKALIKSLNTHFRGARQREGLVIPSGKQFICLHISNPPSEYDANVEPAKDDLVFSDEPAVLALAEEAFRQFYGQPADVCTGDLNSKQQVERLAIDDGSSISKCVATPSKHPNGRRYNVAPRPETQNSGIAQQASPFSMMTPSRITRSAVPACDSPGRLALRDQGPHRLTRDTMRMKRPGREDMPGSSSADSILVRGRSPARATSAQLTGAIDQWLRHERHMPHDSHAGTMIESPMDEMDLDNHLLSQIGSVGRTHDEQAQLHSSRPLATCESPVSRLTDENQQQGVTSLQMQSCRVVPRQRGAALTDQYGKSISLPSSTPRGDKTREREIVAKSPLAALPTPLITPGKLRQSELNEWYGARQATGFGVPQIVSPTREPARDEDDDEFDTTGFAIKFSDSEKEIAFRFSILRKTDGYSASCAHMSDIASQLDSTEALRYWSSRLCSFMKENYCFENAVSGESSSCRDVIQKFIRDQKAR
ncbi:hypothetical protein KEM56_001163 [Ascosphaera pollenicola]|nr:hypothetical protein KEM56_001163 [Ascosphaera pollenicola]